MKSNSSINTFTSCKTDINISIYCRPCLHVYYITMQELVKRAHDKMGGGYHVLLNVL